MQTVLLLPVCGVVLHGADRTLARRLAVPPAASVWHQQRTAKGRLAALEVCALGDLHGWSEGEATMNGARSLWHRRAQRNVHAPRRCAWSLIRTSSRCTHT